MFLRETFALRIGGREVQVFFRWLQAGSNLRSGRFQLLLCGQDSLGLPFFYSADSPSSESPWKATGPAIGLPFYRSGPSGGYTYFFRTFAPFLRVYPYLMSSGLIAPHPCAPMTNCLLKSSMAQRKGGRSAGRKDTASPPTA